MELVKKTCELAPLVSRDVLGGGAEKGGEEVRTALLVAEESCSFCERRGKISGT